MTLTTYSFAKDRKSTKIPESDGTQHNIVIKENTSIDNPTFILTYSGVPTFDYCKWVLFYYFVEDVVLQSKDVYEITCKLDVLATYRNDILSSTQFVTRSTSNYGLNIKDTEILPTFLQSKTEQATSNSVLDTDGCFILRCIGKATPNNFRSFGISSYIVDIQQITNIVNSVFDDQVFNMTSGFGLDDICELLKCIFADPKAYLVSINWIPISSSVLTTIHQERVYLGFYPTTVNDAYILQDDYYEGTDVLSNFTRYYGDFRDFDNSFTQFTLSIPCVGIININPSDAYAGLKVTTYMEILTGTIIYTIYRNDTNAIIGRYKTNVNCTIQIGGVTHGINTGAMISSSASSSLFGTVKESIKDIGAPSTDVIGNIGSKAEVKFDKYFRLTRRIYGSTDSPINHKGKPLYEYKTLSSLSGYCECRDAKLDTTAYGIIKDEIIKYMNEGFFIE